MKNKISLVTWNIGGAKFLQLHDSDRVTYLQKLNNSISSLCNKYTPDFLLLQEAVQYGNDVEHLNNVVLPPDGYYYDYTSGIDTLQQAHPAKWKPYQKKGNWTLSTYLSQGLGILWKKELLHAPIWEWQGHAGEFLQKEVVHLDSGLYTGDRDTEPRLAIVSHYIINNSEIKKHIFIVNIHLTTLKGEREGFPERDFIGSEQRLLQLDIILKGIVSRFNQWAKCTANDDFAHGIWVIAGDFNCTPLSNEIRRLTSANFADMNTIKGTGTKGCNIYLTQPSLTVDYIFAGPQYYALNPKNIAEDQECNPPPLGEFQVSDHLPVMATISLS